MIEPLKVKVKKITYELIDDDDNNHNKKHKTKTLNTCNAILSERV